jgi:hypothetical protein
MNLTQLRTFVRVAEMGSFSKAAIELDTAQPALSMRPASESSRSNSNMPCRCRSRCDLLACLGPARQPRRKLVAFLGESRLANRNL